LVATPVASLAQRRKGERTAERILDAAEALFAERGYAGATLRDVAARVGLRNPSLYNHFASKEALYRAVLERGIGPVLETLNQFLEPGAATYLDSRRVLQRVMELLGRHPSLPRLIEHEVLAGGERLTPILRDWLVPAFARARLMVEATAPARSWSPERLPLLVLAMYHVVVGYFTVASLYRELNGQDLLAPAALERQTGFLIELVERLLGGTSG
jgi:AcrR family transcriptional regulator